MTHTFEGDVPRFNQRFYEGDPAAYLRGRLDQWMATATEAGAFAAVRAESSTGLASDNDGVDPAVLSFLVTDAVLLHHHAAETVVRYYLAHVDEHPAPWTVLAERRHRYHEVVQKRLLKPGPQASEVAYIVYGAEEPAPAANLDEWNNAVDGAIDFLRSMADTYLDGAPMYNSLKHGLGAATGRTDVSFVENLADPTRPTVAEIRAGLHLGSGPRVEYPTRAKSNDGNVWSLTTEWVDVEQSIRLILIAIGLLENIRTVGKRRRALDEVSDTVMLFSPGPFRASNMRSPNRSVGHRMSYPWLREPKKP